MQVWKINRSSRRDLETTKSRSKLYSNAPKIWGMENDMKHVALEFIDNINSGHSSHLSLWMERCNHGKLWLQMTSQPQRLITSMSGVILAPMAMVNPGPTLFIFSFRDWLKKQLLFWNVPFLCKGDKQQSRNSHVGFHIDSYFHWYFNDKSKS